MAHVDPSLNPVPVPVPSFSTAPDDPGKALSAPSRGLVLLGLLLLLGFVAVKGRELWREWARYRVESTIARTTIVIGYQNINPRPSYAQKPEGWIHEEGTHTLLWSGWKPGVGHGWFRVGRGEIDRERLSMPIGRDVVQAIDYPIVEVDGGNIWGRIPPDSPVVVQEIGGVASVYPVQVLDKVQVVNDEVEGRSVLIVCDPRTGRDRSIDIYDPMIEGHRLTMGLTGYHHDGHLLLYDRGTESLWVEKGTDLTAIAGTHKGARFRRIGRPSPISWGDCCSEHPRSRLVVGADRSRQRPSL